MTDNFTKRIEFGKMRFNSVLNLLPVFFVLALSFSANAQITGSVFRDFNGNGVQEENEPFIEGVVVRAYNASGEECGNAVSTSETTAPNYELSGCGDAVVRVEFTIPQEYCVSNGIDFSGFSGGVYGSSVQFTTGNGSDINFAVQNPGDHNSGAENTLVFTGSYANGDPLGGGTSGQESWFVGFPYTNEGDTPPIHAVDGSVIGSVWGTVYSRQAGKIFASALVKRHTGLGVLGSGGIYILQPAGNSFDVETFYDFDANGHRTRASENAPDYGEGSSFELIGTPSATVNYLGDIDPLTGKPTGFGVIGLNTERGLHADKSEPNHDPAAFDQVGKVGLGAMQISDDGKFLFVVNLYSRLIFRLELDDAENPTDVIDVTSYPLPDISCGNGVLRPFGLKYYRNKLYVGAVCSGENGGENIVDGNSDLEAYVFQLIHPTAAAQFVPDPVIAIPLNYRKGKARTGFPENDKWYPWTNNSDILNATSSATPPTRGSYAQPVLSGIDFSDRGDLILAFMDRGGHQWGHQNKRFLGNSEQLVRYQIGGDILIAGKNCETGAFELEDNGSFNSSGVSYTSEGQDNLQGPGGGEFFFMEISEEIHEETHMGAIAVLYGYDRVFNTVMNPIVVFSGGTVLFSTSDGLSSNEYQIYGSENLTAGTLGKANGLGDIAFSLTNPPIEIGNYVWLDTNGDGIQTADESGIDGVTVELYKEDVLVGTTVTSNGGQYYFNDATVNLGGESGLMTLTEYEIRIPFNQEPLEEYNLTLTNASPIGGSLADHSDNDGMPGPGYAFIQMVTHVAGANNHTYDFGFNNLCPDPIEIQLETENVSICGGSDGVITISGLAPDSEYTVSYSYNGQETGPLPIQANPSGEIILANLESGVYTLVTVTLDDCTTTDFTELIITDPETPVFEVEGVSPDNCIGGNGIINIFGLDANQTYEISYLFNNNSQGPFSWQTNDEGLIEIANLAIGEYSEFTVSIDECTGENNTIIELEFPEAPVFSVNSSQPTRCEDADGSITILGLNSETLYEITYKYNGLIQGPYDFESDMSGEILISDLSGGIYSEILVSLNSCETEYQGQVLLTEPEGPEFEVNATDPTVCDDVNGSLIISGLISQNEYLISYNFDGQLFGPYIRYADSEGQIEISDLGRGSYTSISVSLNGCETVNDETINLIEPEGPEFSVSADSPGACLADDGFILISDLIPFFDYRVQYRKDNMMMGPFDLSSDELGEILIDNLEEGIYSEIRVSLDGCETVAEDIIVLNDPEGPVFTLSFENPVNCIESDGTIIIAGLESGTAYTVSYNANGTPVGPLELSSDINGEILIANLEPGNYNSISVALQNCETTSMDVIILDEPALPVVDAGSFQQICIGSPIILQAFNPDGALIEWDGGVEDGQLFIPDVGNYIFTVTATLNGCVATDQVSIQVIPDVVTLDCRDIFYNLASGACGIVLDLNIDILDGCVPGGSDSYIVQYVSGVQSGDYLEGGEYTSSWQLVDSEGNITDECTINISVIPFDGENVTLVCNDLVNISIGPGCIAEITADMLLEGTGYNCYDEYIVTISYPQITGINSYPNADFSGANLIDFTHVGLTLVVFITDPATGNTCWGRIAIEDKLPPVLECESIELPCTSNYADIRDPRGNQIVFPGNLFWPRDFSSTAADLSIAINQRRFTVLANIIDCTEVTLTYSDRTVNGNCEDPDGIFRTVIRTWVAKDSYGNTSSCDQIITFRVLTIDELLEDLGIETMITVGCNASVPEIITGPITCNIWFGLNNELKLPLCGEGDSSYKLFRTYTVFDDCTGEMREFSQVIIVKDEIPPVIVECGNGQLPTRRVAANAIGCNAEVVLTLPLVVDNCSQNVSVIPSIPNVQLTFISGTWRAWLSLGKTYEVIWIAYDECGNSQTCIENIVVEDRTAPVAVCIEFTKVSLTAQIQQNGIFEDAFARVYAHSFDNGSYDNCEIFDFKVMRMANTNSLVCGQSHNTSENPPLGSVFNPLSPNAPYWRDYVDFCCEDLGSDEPIMVVLRVRDIYGNVNYCMVNVEVESKIPPVLTPPDNVTIDCRDILNIEELTEILINRELSITRGFGWVGLSALCEEELRVSVSAALTDCGVTDLQNRVRRTFSAGTGVNTRSVTQEIFVVNESPFRILNVQPGGVHNRIDDIVWPVDLDLPSCNEAYDLQSLKERYNEKESTFFDFAELGESTRPRSMPFLRPVACSIPGVGYDDWTFELEGGCIKIIRQWKVIDWCQIDPQTGTYKQWMYEQIIKILDSAPAVFEEITIRLSGNGIVSNEETIAGCPDGLVTLIHMADDCSPSLYFELAVSDDCSKPQNITYSYELLIGDNPNFFVSSNSIVSGNGNVNALGMFGFNFGTLNPNFQNKVHRIVWALDDRCGNVTICEFDFIIKDGKKPSPICTDEIIAVLMPSGGMISLEAALFNVASSDNCSGTLNYSFNAPFGQPDALVTRVFDCTDYVNNFNAETLQSIITLPVFVTDASGNFDFCLVRVQLQDNEGICDDVGSIVIKGHIENSRKQKVSISDELKINGYRLSSDADWIYSLRIPEMTTKDLPYTIKPQMNDNPLNGVTTLDIVFIQRHILGQNTIENPYERIAADVNGDGKINALDILELRQLILLKRNDFTGKNAGLSWKFIDKGYDFSTVFPESENYRMLREIKDEKNLDNNHFVAIKLGDVNSSATFNLGFNEERVLLENGNIVTENKRLERGDVYTITLRMEQPQEIAGFQMALLFSDRLEILKVESSDLIFNESNYGVFSEEGLLTITWNGELSKTHHLLEITIKALESIDLKDEILLSVKRNHPQSEYYSKVLEVNTLNLKFVTEETENLMGYDLLQNEPNPFRNDTKIGFLLPKQERARIEIYSGAGHVVKVIEGNYRAGLNTFVLSSADLGGAGVYYYSVTTANYQGTKKMILIE